MRCSFDFDDGADFVDALWDILLLFDNEAEYPEDLEYIEDETDTLFFIKLIYDE